MSKSLSKLPVGVFDSGVGGLTIVRAIRKTLPNESILYFGDIARLPYGTKSREQIQRFSEENAAFLTKLGVKALVIACNSSSSVAHDLLKRKHDFPVLDVIQPAVEEALRNTVSGRIGVLGTQATVGSGVYSKFLKQKKKSLQVFSVACPLFVPVVEEDMWLTKVGKEIIEHYLKDLKRKKVDTLILGCTHYPLLKKEIQKYMGKQVYIVDSAEPCALSLLDALKEKELLNHQKSGAKLSIYLSDVSPHFKKVGEKFLNEKLTRLKIVRS